MKKFAILLLLLLPVITTSCSGDSVSFKYKFKGEYSKKIDPEFAKLYLDFLKVAVSYHNAAFEGQTDPTGGDTSSYLKNLTDFMSVRVNSLRELVHEDDTIENELVDLATEYTYIPDLNGSAQETQDDKSIKDTKTESKKLLEEFSKYID